MRHVTQFINEDIGGAVGGVSAPMTTTTNTPGMGNPTPGTPSTNNMGTGDKWGTKRKPATQGPPTKNKKRRVTKIEEDNINPYDKIGTAMAKKMGVKTPFKKKKASGNQNSMKQAKFEHVIITLDEFLNEALSDKYNEDDDIWTRAYHNTETHRIRTPYGDEWLPGCVNCEEIVKPSWQHPIPRQMLGNAYQAVGYCSKCGHPIVIDQHNERMLQLYLENPEKYELVK